MKPAFISYRRKDTVDVSGRIFDRLTGYFGPGSTLLDVDALVAGGNYRTQIERLLDRCHVTLAIIGQEWLTATDDAGRRRLDNPDDQLRIEIAVALKSGRTVIPVLVHDAQLPKADQLPDDIKGLAACDPHVVQSGTPFNTDVQMLIERLEASGMRPPEQSFPWQTVLLPLGIAMAIASVLSFTLMNGPKADDFILQQLDPSAPLSELRTINDYEAFDGKPYDLVRYDQSLRRTLLLSLLPMMLGPMLIVWGKRVCCLGKERAASRRHYAQGAGRLPTPKSGKSVLCLALGLASIGGGLLTAIPALIVGALAWSELRRRPTWMRGRSLVVTGVLASLVGIGIFFFFHLPEWRFRSWIAAMDAAHAAAMAGDDEAALRRLDEAIVDGRDNPRTVAVARIRRGAALTQLDRSEEGAAELTEAIDALEGALPDNVSYLDQYDPTYLEQAHLRRAEAYDRLGKASEAEADRQWNTSELYNRGDGAPAAAAPFPPAGDDETAPIQAPEPPPPAAPAAPGPDGYIPPVPVADPNA